jgi:hypothetical protein
MIDARKERKIKEEKERAEFEKRLKKIGNKNERKIAIQILRGKF